MVTKRSVVLAGVVAGVMGGACAVSARASIVADSITQFSGTQGQSGWFYGWMLPADAPGSFRPMEEFDGERWWVDSERYWTMLGPVGGHANGLISSGFATREEQWAVRRWVSDCAGEMNVEVTLRKLNINPSSNGVLGRLLVDGVEVWSRYASGTDAVGVVSHVGVLVEPGTTLDFVMDPFESNDWSDNAQFSAKITAVPGPGAAGVVAVGVVLMGRRRR